MQLLGLPLEDPRDQYVGTTLQKHAYSYRKSADGTRPVAQVIVVHDPATEFVVHIFQSDANPQAWFKDLCWHIDGRDEICLSGQIPEIKFVVGRKSKRGSEGREGLNAVPAPLADQTAEMQSFLENLSDRFPAGRFIELQQSHIQEAEGIAEEVDQIKGFTNKEENRGKCDQRPRGRKDPELMAIVRVAARRAGYKDDTPSAAYTAFINAVLWQAAEEGLLFRVRHAIMDSKSGDAHYTND
tara:strand:- start:1403 stop:2125 length:723 start_codon:yes stop_codon:yes gene_type:complete